MSEVKEGIRKRVREGFAREFPLGVGVEFFSVGSSGGEARKEVMGLRLMAMVNGVASEKVMALPVEGGVNPALVLGQLLKGASREFMKLGAATRPQVIRNGG